jgi:hypothetical protein
MSEIDVLGKVHLQRWEWQFWICELERGGEVNNLAAGWDGSRDRADREVHGSDLKIRLVVGHRIRGRELVEPAPRPPLIRHAG